MINDELRLLARSTSSARDLTDPTQNERVLTLADELLALGGPGLIAANRELTTDTELVAEADPVFLEALASAVGKLRLQEAVGATSGPRPLLVSVVFAMYGEGSRILARTEDPHGEDFLRVKVAQLTWLFDRIDPGDATWHLVAVDDGCPDTPSSAELASGIVEAEGLSDRVTVLRLADAIDDGTAIATTAGVNDAFAAMTSPADSRKGGSILYGLWHALDRVGPDAAHVLLYTDADLSTNLTQTGALVDAILVGGHDAAIGQRYGVPGSILVKDSGPMTEPASTGTKPDKHIILLRHQVRATLIPSLASVLDTQAGFKAFTASSLLRTIPSMTSLNETFDVELLINTDHRSANPGEAIAVEPIVFTEDFGQTNFPSVDPGERHLAMIRQIVEIYDAHVADHRPATGDAAALLDACRRLSVDDYVAIIERLRADDDRWPADALFDRPIDVDGIVGAVGSR